MCIGQAFRPSTAANHKLPFKTFLAFLVFMQLPVEVNIHNIFTFLEYLYCKHVSSPVLKSYISSIQSMCSRFNIDSSPLNHFTVSRYLTSITINSAFSPTPRGIFDIKTLYQISIACNLLPDPLLYRAIFLEAFFKTLQDYRSHHVVQ